MWLFYEGIVRTSIIAKCFSTLTCMGITEGFVLICKFQFSWSGGSCGSDLVRLPQVMPNTGPRALVTRCCSVGSLTWLHTGISWRVVENTDVWVQPLRFWFNWHRLWAGHPPRSYFKVQQTLRATLRGLGQVPSCCIASCETPSRCLLPALSWGVLGQRSLDCTNWCCCPGKAMCQRLEHKCRPMLDTWWVCIFLKKAWRVNYFKNLNHLYIQCNCRENICLLQRRKLSEMLLTCQNCCQAIKSII